MVDLIGKLQAIIKPPGEGVWDTEWLDVLPRDNYLVVQDILLRRLRDFVTENNPYDAAALSALICIDERGRQNVAALTAQYANAPVLAFEVDERLWQSVYDYYHVLDRAYQSFLDHHSAYLAQSPIAADLPQLLLNLVDCLRCAAKWRYLRYQAMSEGGWLRLHRLYRLAEHLGCVDTRLKRHVDSPETSLMSCYLQALMLDTLNHTSMLKSEIEMLAGWLSNWCEVLTLDAEYSEAQHLFFVGQEEDRGGRRIRHFQPSASDRYWDTDKVVMQVMRLSHYVRQSHMPDDLLLPTSVSFNDCRLLIEHLLAEWSRNAYQRQRRSDERHGVAKVAQVVNGVVNVCQHIRNVHVENEVRPVPEEGSIVQSAASAETWMINNESKYGFGAMVSGVQNPWLRPGRLITLDYEMNPDMPVLGVVRRVERLPGDMRHVGIEVLCHTPAHVHLKYLAQSTHMQEFLPPEIFAASVADTQGQPPFLALYLTGDHEKGMPPTLLMPFVEFKAGGIFELGTEHYHNQVRLSRVVEQKDDWVRVQLRLSGAAPVA